MFCLSAAISGFLIGGFIGGLTSLNNGNYFIEDFAESGVYSAITGFYTAALMYCASRVIRVLFEIPIKPIKSKVAGKDGLYRRTSNLGKFSKLSENMSLKNVKNVAKKAGVGLDGIKVKIVRDPDLIGSGLYGYADPKGIMYLYPDAFTNTETLVRTLGHERIHFYQSSVFEVPTNSTTVGLFETAAYLSEDSWWRYFNG